MSDMIFHHDRPFISLPPHRCGLPNLRLRYTKITLRPQPQPSTSLRAHIVLVEMNALEQTDIDNLPDLSGWQPTGDSNATDAPDRTERRRLQNRQAQRNHSK